MIKKPRNMDKYWGPGKSQKEKYPTKKENKHQSLIGGCKKNLPKGYHRNK